MSTIYSRKRFLIKPMWKKWKTNKQNKIIKIVIILSLIVLIIKYLVDYFEPTFKTLCEEKVKSIATIITNQQSTIIMNKYQYQDLYKTEKDENTDIVIIKANVVPINNMISDLTENVQKEFDEIKKTQIDIPIGSFFGNYLTYGMGPNISIKTIVSGTLDTEVKSEFIAQGINQTLHRIYVEFDCNMKIVSRLTNYEKRIVNQVIIAEHVIVGKIPQSYYNFDNINKEDALNVLE